MALIYFPSCKYTARYPELSRKINDYVRREHGAKIADCCFRNVTPLTREDVAVYICIDCSGYLMDISPVGRVISLWELLADDPGLVWPDYGQKPLTLQDCWLTIDYYDHEKAVRRILEKMNVKIVELGEKWRKTTFRGCWSYRPSQNPSIIMEGLFPQPPGETRKDRLMKEHCSQITTPEVVCCCQDCITAINHGGKKALHLSELIFPASETAPLTETSSV